jgi:hypothetical protein
MFAKRLCPCAHARTSFAGRCWKRCGIRVLKETAAHRVKGFVACCTGVSVGTFWFLKRPRFFMPRRVPVLPVYRESSLSSIQTNGGSGTWNCQSTKRGGASQAGVVLPMPSSSADGSTPRESGGAKMLILPTVRGSHRRDPMEGSVMAEARNCSGRRSPCACSKGYERPGQAEDDPICAA